MMKVEEVVYSKKYLKKMLNQNPSLRGIEHVFVKGKTVFIQDKKITVCKFCMYDEDNFNHIKMI